MSTDQHAPAEDRCFCGAEWIDEREECAAGHAFGEADKFRDRAEKAEARVADLERTAQAAEDMRDASDARVAELEAVLARVRTESPDNLIAAMADDALRGLVVCLSDSVSGNQENKMSDHEFKFMSAHGQDAPGMSCDTYDQCVACGLVRHDYRHGGGQRSPNYPIYLVRGVHHATPPPCIGIISETNGKNPATHLGDDDCG